MDDGGRASGVAASGAGVGGGGTGGGRATAGVGSTEAASTSINAVTSSRRGNSRGESPRNNDTLEGAAEDCRLLQVSMLDLQFQKISSVLWTQKLAVESTCLLKCMHLLLFTQLPRVSKHGYSRLLQTMHYNRLCYALHCPGLVGLTRSPCRGQGWRRRRRAVHWAWREV